MPYPSDHIAAQRKLICCVFAIEIAEHDARPVFDQIRITQDLRRALADAASDVPAEELVTHLREDGALLAFIADPVACLRAALALREACLTQERYRDLQPRIGIDLGPVELVEDELGQAYMGGAARRDAERLLRQSPPRQVAVTRSFFELLARLAPELAARLRYQGLLSDMQGPPLGWYALDPLTDPRRQRVHAEAVPHAAAGDEALQTAPVGGPAVCRRAARRWALLPLAALALLIAPGGRVERPPASSPATAQWTMAHVDPNVAAPATEVAAVARAPAAVDARTIPAARKRAPIRRLQGQPPLHAAGMDPVRRVAPQDNPRSDPAPVAAHAPQDRDAERRTQVPKTAAIVRLAVRPWGEVHVDGRKVALTPPTKTLSLPPGRHVITVTNGALPPLRRELLLSAAGAPVTLAHDFGCVPVRDIQCREADAVPLLASAHLRPRTSGDRSGGEVALLGRAGRPQLAAATPRVKPAAPQALAAAP